MSYVPPRRKRRIPLDLAENTPYQGRIINWNDEKGYGFIQLMPGHENLFFHISTFAYHHRRPAADTAVTVLAIPGNKGGWQASRVLLREHEHAIMEDSIYDSQQRRYQAALGKHPPRALRLQLRLAAKLDRITKGAEHGDYWQTLKQHLLNNQQRQPA